MRVDGKCVMEGRGKMLVDFGESQMVVPLNQLKKIGNYIAI